MKKVGILSMQRVINYGSYLQAYGLKNTIKNMGFDVEFVDYHVEGVDNSNNGSLMKSIKHYLSMDGKFSHKVGLFFHRRNFPKKYFERLGIKEYNYTPVLDYLVIGSDEVFNCFQKAKEVGYSLELFGKDNKANCLLSYAASFGNTTMEKIEENGKKDELSFYLNKFNYISVRDKNSFGIIEELTKKTPSLNIDPVLLYDFTKDNNFSYERKIKSKYLLLYAYTGRISKEEAKYIKEYAKKKKLKIVCIGGIEPCGGKFVDCSPYEIFGYFKYAEEIITDTFHGTIFSIINKNKFHTLVRKSKNGSYGNEEKLSYLLHMFELDNQLIYDINEIDGKQEDINYSRVFEILEEERLKSKEYLSNALK